MTLNEIGYATYIALETFKQNGQGVITPIWITQEGGKLYAMTDASSWKVKRIRHNKQVRIAKSDGRGNVQSEWLEAQARILDDATAWPQMEKRIKAKYGFQYGMISLVNRLRRSKRGYVVIEIENAV